MLELSIKISPDGQITLPADIQQRLGVHGGDEVLLVVDGDEIHLRRNASRRESPKPKKLSDFFGILPTTRVHQDMGEVRQTVADMVVQKYIRDLHDWFVGWCKYHSKITDRRAAQTSSTGFKTRPKSRMWWGFTKNFTLDRCRDSLGLNIVLQTITLRGCKRFNSSVMNYPTLLRKDGVSKFPSSKECFLRFFEPSCCIPPQ